MTFNMHILSLTIIASTLLGACTPPDTGSDTTPTTQERFSTSIKRTTVEGQMAKIEATYFCLSGENSPQEVGVAISREPNGAWQMVASSEVTSPYTIVIDSLEAETTYNLYSYAKGSNNIFTSSTRQITTDKAVYDPTPHPDSVSWSELPSIIPETGERFITHFTQLNGKRRRNYSMLYDTDNKVALWVAYPLHSCYMGSSGRTEAWDFDPVVPITQQCDMSRAGFIDDNGYSAYDRGHQLPSADRTIDNDTNAATFYYTNMTPQQSSFNRGLWGSLEEFVRKNVPEQDTLFVVTGCALTTPDEPTILYARHKTFGEYIAVPRAYFKVLVCSSRNGSLPQDDNAKCIGFWLPNASATGTKLNASLAMSVSQIESLTGFEFFPYLSDEAKSRLNTSTWKW